MRLGIFDRRKSGGTDFPSAHFREILKSGHFSGALPTRMPLKRGVMGVNFTFFRAQPKTRLPGGHTNRHGGGIPQKKGLFFSVPHFFPRAGNSRAGGFFRLFWCTFYGLKPLFSQNIGGRRKSFFLEKIAPTAGFPGFSPEAKKVTFCDFPETGHFLHTRARGRWRGAILGTF